MRRRIVSRKYSMQQLLPGGAKGAWSMYNTTSGLKPVSGMNSANSICLQVVNQVLEQHPTFMMRVHPSSTVYGACISKRLAAVTPGGPAACSVSSSAQDPSPIKQAKWISKVAVAIHSCKHSPAAP